MSTPMMSRFDPLVHGLKILGASARLLCAAGLLLISMVESVSASGSVQRSLSVRAEVAARNSLKTSAEILQFEVMDPDQPATASIQFSAGTRTQPDGEVLLIVEQLAAPERISDGRESGASEGMEPASVDAVDVSAPGRKVAKRWIGSGLRHGTIDFVLRAPEPGRYDVTLQFMLSAP